MGQTTRPVFSKGRLSVMSIVKINAITVADGEGDELARRFAKRAGAVESQDGFEGFELLQPVGDRNVWLVVTHWRDEAAFDAWVASRDFQKAHSRPPSGESDENPTGSGEPPRKPLNATSELWTYNVVERTTPAS